MGSSLPRPGAVSQESQQPWSNLRLVPGTQTQTRCPPASTRTASSASLRSTPRQAGPQATVPAPPAECEALLAFIGCPASQPQGTFEPRMACTGGTPSATSQVHWLTQGSWSVPGPVCTRLVTDHSLQACPALLRHPICPRQAPHLLGLSLRLVLRALKLSFSGVSSKDRRTLERRPWQNGAELSCRTG